MIEIGNFTPQGILAANIAFYENAALTCILFLLVELLINSKSQFRLIGSDEVYPAF